MEIQENVVLVDCVSSAPEMLVNSIATLPKVY